MLRVAAVPQPVAEDVAGGAAATPGVDDVFHAVLGQHARAERVGEVLSRPGHKLGALVGLHLVGVGEARSQRLDRSEEERAALHDRPAEGAGDVVLVERVEVGRAEERPGPELFVREDIAAGAGKLLLPDFVVMATLTELARPSATLKVLVWMAISWMASGLGERLATP